MIGPDLIFSYWIFAWTLVYIMFPNEISSPLLALDTALVINIVELLYIIRFHYNIWTVAKFTGMIIIIKVVPIFVIYYYYNKKINLRNDLQNMAILFLFYNIYLLAHNTNYYEICKKGGEAILNGENISPMFRLFDKIYTINKS